MNTEFEFKRDEWRYISICLVFYDILAIIAVFFLSIWLHYNCHFMEIPNDLFNHMIYYMPINVIVSLLIFRAFHLYQSVWRFVSYYEIILTFCATVVSVLLHWIGMRLLFGKMFVSYYVIGGILEYLAILVPRFIYRFIQLAARFSHGSEGKQVMIIGAGSAGRQIARDIRNTEFIHEHVVCFIDDNPQKKHRYIDGIRVAGDRSVIFEECRKHQIKKIYLAIPSLSQDQEKEILNICKETQCELKKLPSFQQLATEDVKVTHMRDVAVEDLLGRDTIKANSDDVKDQLHGKVVMVTGGGGSIGSELCRQIAAAEPKTLIIFDIYENNAYDIQLELKKKYPNLDLHAIIGSVRDSRKIFAVMREYRPQIVYHAAAHKHVPLMEDSPCEAIKNNAVGTYKTAFAAMANGCERFLLISTDKAVNPTNIMGASKRLCEMVVQAFDAKVKEGKAYELPEIFTHWIPDHEAKHNLTEDLRKAKTEFVAVRFGNVLGSNGSVIPLFKKQIAAGGPVTVTHPDIIRYFMTIPEAVSLVLEAGNHAKGGEIFVLDMGEPVKIDTLARNLIKLSGYRPDIDIMIVYSGLRPGEKLYEEKLMAEEGLRKTDSDLIHIGCPIPFDIEEFLAALDGLMKAAYRNAPDIKQRVAKIVSTYKL